MDEIIVGLEGLLATLDRSEEMCDCCGRPKKHNWEDHKRAIEIEAMVRKLKSWQTADLLTKVK